MAANDLSPPERRLSFFTFLPLGWTFISIPVSNKFSLLVNSSEPFPPGNNCSNISPK